MRRSPTLVYLIFVLSGAAGLIYEIVWARQLVLVFGNTTQAVSAILTGFFGGMAIGSVIGGRIADRVRSPLRMYGVLEIALVVVVLLTPLTFGLIHELYRGGYAALQEQPQALALLRFADRKSTRLNSSHANISYAVFCLKKKKNNVNL